MFKQCVTTLVCATSLLLAACGGDASVGIGTGGGSGGGGSSQPAAPAGVYTGATVDRQYLVATAPTGSSVQTIWWYSHSQSDQINVGVLDGFMIGTLTATGNSTNGSFSVNPLINYSLAAADTPTTTLTANTYASGDIMGTLNDGASVSYHFSSVSVPVTSLSDLATAGPYDGVVLDKTGTTTSNISIQVYSNGGFDATGSTCSSSGTLTATDVNGVFFVSNIVAGTTSCLGDNGASGMAVKYAGVFYLAVSTGAGTSAVLFRGN